MFIIRATPIDSTNEIGISINNETADKLIVKPAKTSYWKTFNVNGIHLKAGKNLLRIEAIEGNFNLNYFQFAPQNK